MSSKKDKSLPNLPILTNFSLPSPKRHASIAAIYRLKAIPGISAMGAITLLSRIGDIKRFKNPDSLANYFGLTPGCRNTGGKHRIGGITKRGNAVARVVLNFAVNHIARKDLAMKAWRKKIKNKKGQKRQELR